jgi:hypothetical protein
MTAPFKRIKCPTHQAVAVARIEIEPDGRKVVAFDMRADMRTDIETGVITGGRKAEPENAIRLALDDVRIARGRIPYVVTWCPKCRGELVIPMDWLQEEAKHSGTARAPIGVLESARQLMQRPGPEART